MLEVQLFFDEDDRYNNIPMYEHIMRYLMHHEIRGATLIAALGGFGVKRHLHYPRKLAGADEGPLMLLFIDTDERVQAVLPHLRMILHEGLIVARSVDIMA